MENGKSVKSMDARFFLTKVDLRFSNKLPASVFQPPDTEL